MAVKYRMQRFGPNKEKWWFRIIPRRTVALREMAQRIEEASSLTVGDVMAAADALASRVRASLAQGDSVQIDGIGTFSLSARGLADSYDEHLDPQQLDVVFRPDPQLRRYVRTRADREREAPRERAPNPREFTDAASERSDAYTAGSIGSLYGSVLKFDPDDPAQGVFFVAQDGSETRATVYSHVGDKRVHFLIPPGLTGAQRLLVRAQPRFAPQVRQGELSQELEAA